MEFLRRRLSDGNFLAGGMGGDPPGAGPGLGGTPPGGGGAGRPLRTPPTAPLLLVIAPPGTDWVKPFKGKSVHGDVELRVEQAQFSELSLAASTHGALSVTIDTPRGGTRRVRPDFVLVREAPEGGAGDAPRKLLVGLHLGGVPSTDPLPALYGFAHPPCLFAQLARLQRELGPEAFPLVPQRFCNRPRGLLSSPTFPMTVTLSPAPAGVGQVRVGTPQVLGAVAAAMGGARAGALVRGGPTGTQRLRVQRIGDEYRALRWSLGAGDAVGEGPQVEPVALSPRHRGWVDACAGLFGGVDICAVEALRGPDGQEHIVQVLGSWLPLLGPGAAEDRGRIVELVLERMRAELPRPRSPSPARPRPQMSATSASPRPGTPPQQRPQPQGAPPPSGPAQPRPAPQGQPRPQMGGASPRPAQPRPQTPPGAAQPRPQTPPTSPQPQAPPSTTQPRPPLGAAVPQPRPPTPQPRPQTPPTAQPRPQAPPTSPQPRPQAPPTAQPRPQVTPTSPQPRPQAPPTAQARPQAPPTSPQPRPQATPTYPQPRPQAPPTPQPRPQAPPTAQPRPQAPPTSPQPRPQAPPTSQPRPQAPPTAQPRPQAPPTAQPRPQAPPTSPQPRPQAPPSAQPRPPGPATSPQPRPQAPPTSPQPRLPRSPSVPQPRPQAPPPAAMPRPPGPQAPPTTRQPRPQAPPLAPKPALAPKPGGAPPPSPAPEQGPPESLRALRQSFASLFAD